MNMSRRRAFPLGIMHRVAETRRNCDVRTVGSNSFSESRKDAV